MRADSDRRIERIFRGRLGALLLLVVLSLIGLAKAQAALTSIATGVQIGADARVVVLSPEPALASALGQGGLPIVLAVEGVEGAAVQPIRINIFLNKPDADNHTSTDSPSCLGFIQLLPTQGVVRRVNYAFDLSQTGNLDPAKPISITLVPVIGTDSRPRDVSLRIGRLYIRQEH